MFFASCGGVVRTETSNPHTHPIQTCWPQDQQTCILTESVATHRPSWEPREAAHETREKGEGRRDVERGWRNGSVRARHRFFFSGRDGTTLGEEMEG